MKKMLTAMLLLAAISALCLEVTPFGPQADTLFYTDYQETPLAVGGILNQQYGVFLDNGTTWDFYPFWANGLPFTGMKKLNESTLLVAMGGYNSFSDGVYNFDLLTHLWSENEWFMSPNFLKYNPSNSTYYVGERDGLFKSTDGINWSRINAVGMSRCSSLAFFGNNIVTNNGSLVKYSTDNGQSWQTASASNLKGFYYSSSGVLYALMDDGSDSDGLWRSLDNGASWDCMLFTSHLNCIGPDYGNHLVLGWSETSEEGAYVALVNQQYQITNLQHDNLDSGVRQQDIFPLVNTPSFFVINAEGCFFVTDFLPVNNEDETIPVMLPLSVSVYPNPFHAQTSISIDNWIKHEALKAEIYNLKGQLIRSLAEVSPLIWDGRDFSGRNAGSGIYLLKVSQGRETAYHKLLKMK